MCSSLAYENTGHASKSFRFFLVLAFSLTLGNYTERLIPGNTITGSFLPQQMLAVTAWSSVFASVLLFESGARQRSLHLMLYVFIYYCGLTSLWGNDPKGGVSTAIVLFYTTTIVSVVVSRLGINEVVDGVRRAMMALISVSVVLAVFLPSVGVLDTWNHAGKWNGIFSTKQDLGFCSSFYPATKSRRGKPALYYMVEKTFMITPPENIKRPLSLESILIFVSSKKSFALSMET